MMKNYRTKAVLTFAVMAVAMLLAPVGTTQAGSETQSFNSAASAGAAGWTEFKSRDGVADYGWSNTNNAGTTGGEAGGIIARVSPVSYYADVDLGGAFSADDNLSATGSIYFDDTLSYDGEFYIGWFDKTKAEVNDKDYLGIHIQEPSGGNWRIRAKIDGATGPTIYLPDKTVLYFTITYDGATKTNTVNFTDGGLVDETSVVTSTNTLVLDAFGMVSNNQTGNQDGELYIDDLTYTSLTDPNAPSVEILTDDTITWSAEPVALEPNVVEADGSDWNSLTYLWTAEPNGIGDADLDVDITNDTQLEEVSVTITKTGVPTDDATVITLTLAVNNDGNPPEDAVTYTMTIDVYDTACLATREGVGLKPNGDIVVNCDTDPADLAAMAALWLNDTGLTEAETTSLPTKAPTIASQYGILDLMANGGINPNTGEVWQADDQYRLAFHTDEEIDAMSNDPNVYDDFATAQAQQNTALAASSGWTAMLWVNTDGTQEQGVGPISSPLDRSGTGDRTGGSGEGGAGVPVYAMDGSTCIARNNDDIYNSWSNPFTGSTRRLDSGSTNLNSDGEEVTASQNVYYSPFLDQFGLGDTANVHGANVWTGGFGSDVNPAGDTPLEVRTSYGSSNANSNGRVWNRFNTENTNTRSLYVISELLTIGSLGVDPLLPVVQAGGDQLTWSGQPITTDPNVIENDETRELTYLWTADPADGVVFSSPVDENDPSTSDAKAPTVTITKDLAAGEVATVELTLAVTLESEEPVISTMQVEVYANSCEAAVAVGKEDYDNTDFNTDCITNLVDFADLAADWLDDYTIPGPAKKL